MDKKERSLVEDVKHAQGNYGGFSFGGQHPEGVTRVNPLPTGVTFPNGAKAALLMTFDVEGNYGNGAGDIQTELANYQRICDRFKQNSIPGTFNIVGKMAEEHGPQFVEWMLDADCEVAAHGYVHDMNKRYGGDYVYAGHYGPEQNREQVLDALKALNKINTSGVTGFRLPYGHFNEYSYDMFEQAQLKWTSNLGIDDFIVPGQGFGTQPFQIQIGDKKYPLVEIPLDSQTYDWSTWIADEDSNGMFVDAVRAYCNKAGIPFVRTPTGAVDIWKRRMQDAIDTQSVFTLLCHPTNLAVPDPRWKDPVIEFLLPVIDILGELHRSGKAWVCTCTQMAEFYWNNI